MVWDAILYIFLTVPPSYDAVTPDGARVYAAGFLTTNRTAVIPDLLVPDGFGPEGMPGPATNFEGEPAPENSLIVQFNGSHWVDTLDRTWDDQVKFSLPDKDVFAIDALATPPTLIAGASRYLARGRHRPFQHGGQPAQREDSTSPIPTPTK